MTRISNSARRGRRRTVYGVGAAALAILLTAGSTTAAHADGSVTVDFGQSQGERSPNVFGGAINELDGAADVAAIRAAGTTFARRDIYLSQILPQTTVSQYLADMAVAGGVDDPNTWDWSKYNWVDTYDAAGLKTMAILSYNISWLAHSNTNHGVPKNWVVYNDIITKIIDRFEGKIDYVEVWNEPDLPQFMDLTNSGYTDRLSAYKEIYRNASAAVKAADSDLPVGGPVLSSTDTSWADAMFKDAGIEPNLDFLSYHQYQKNPDGEVATAALRAVAAANGRGSIPIYLTEWNWDHQYIGSAMNNDSVDAIPYVAQRLDNMIYHNVAGAGYFAFNKQTTHPDFYSIRADGSLTPKFNTYRLLSQQLGLGEGAFTLRPGTWTNGASTLVARGATNSAGENVAWVINTSDVGDVASVTMKGLEAGKTYRIRAWEASRWQDATSTRIDATVTADANGNANVAFWMPYKAVVGIKLN